MKLVSKYAPSLDKLLYKGRITEQEHQALCNGTREDIIEAFNIDLLNRHDDHVKSILIKKAIEDGE